MKHAVRASMFLLTSLVLFQLLPLADVHCQIQMSEDIFSSGTTHMSVEDSYSSGGVSLSFKYDFEICGYGQPYADKETDWSSLQIMWVTGRQEAGTAPHMAMTLQYQGKTYSYSRDLDPGEMYSNFIPYTNYNIQLSVTLTAQIQTQGPCLPVDPIILVPRTSGGGSSRFSLSLRGSTPAGTRIGAIITILVGWGE